MVWERSLVLYSMWRDGCHCGWRASWHVKVVEEVGLARCGDRIYDATICSCSSPTNNDVTTTGKDLKRSGDMISHPAYKKPTVESGPLTQGKLFLKKIKNKMLESKKKYTSVTGEPF